RADQVLGLRPVAAIFHLSKRYSVGGATVQAVSDISMRIERGEFIAVLGRSGSGKSTLISLLGLLDRPDAGQYLFDSQDVTELDENERAFIRSRKIGFVFQMARSWAEVAHWRTSSCRCSTPACRNPNAGASRKLRLIGLAFRIATTIGQASCQAASSSAWGSRVHWSMIRF